jgi:hypothetical protein
VNFVPEQIKCYDHSCIWVWGLAVGSYPLVSGEQCQKKKSIHVPNKLGCRTKLAVPNMTTHRLLFSFYPSLGCQPGMAYWACGWRQFPASPASALLNRKSIANASNTLPTTLCAHYESTTSTSLHLIHAPAHLLNTPNSANSDIYPHALPFPPPKNSAACTPRRAPPAPTGPMIPKTRQRPQSVAACDAIKMNCTRIWITCLQSSTARRDSQAGNCGSSRARSAGKIKCNPRENPMLDGAEQAYGMATIK